MFQMFSLAIAALQLSATLVHAGVVAERATPEVIPGPGLPSLASLNLTSKQLYASK